MTQCSGWQLLSHCPLHPPPARSSSLQSVQWRGSGQGRLDVVELNLLVGVVVVPVLASLQDPAGKAHAAEEPHSKAGQSKSREEGEGCDSGDGLLFLVVVVVLDVGPCGGHLCLAMGGTI